MTSKLLIDALTIAKNYSSTELYSLSVLLFRESVKRAVTEGALPADCLSDSGMLKTFEMAIMPPAGLPSIIEAATQYD